MMQMALATQAPAAGVSKGAAEQPVVAEPREQAPAEAVMSDAEKRETLIRIAAYSFYERRGFVGGHELEDWLQAEMEVERQLAEAGKAKQAD